jgi:hypothetical protein
VVVPRAAAAVDADESQHTNPVFDGDTRMMSRSAVMSMRVVVAMVIASAVGCKSAPRQRPIPGPEIDHGPESISAARKFLQGRWALESFEVFPPGKPAIVLKGSGSLNYDDFGNLRIEIRADEQAADLLRAAGVDTRDGTISTDGKTVIDVQNRTLSYVLPGQTVGAPAAGPLAPSRLRHWEVKGDLLFLSTKDDAGRILSTGRWKRMP